MRDGSIRSAEPGELCSCGRQARDVIATDRFGDVGACYIENAKPLPAVGRILGTFAGDARLVAS